MVQIMSANGLFKIYSCKYLSSRPGCVFWKQPMRKAESINYRERQVATS